MTRTSADPLDDVPEFSPIDHRYKVEEIATVDIHREVYDAAGHKRWKAVLGEWKPHTSLADIKAVAGGGSFRIQARRAGNKPLFTVTRMIDGKPRDGDEPGDEPGDDDADIDDASSDVRAIIKQQSIVLPAAFTSITAALVQGGTAHAERMMAMVQQQQGLLTAHSAQLMAVQTTADARIDSYRAEADRLRAQLADAQKKIDELTGQNVGYLHAMAKAGSGANQLLEAVKEMAPKLPALIRGVKAELGPGPAGGALPNGAPAPPKVQFGG